MRPTPKAKKAIFLGPLCLTLSFLLIASPLHAEKKPDTETKTSKPTKPKGMPVQAVKIEPIATQLWQQYSGNIRAVDSVDIRPQVSGRVKELRFKDGQLVKKGEILIVIDPRPFHAAVKQAKASLKTAKARAELAKKELKRAKKLVLKQAAAERLLDQRTNEYQNATAAILTAEAQVETAEINVDHAYIKAPISGKISRAEITIGNLVQNGSSAPILTSIVANDAVYVDFEIDEQTYLSSVHKAVKGSLKTIPVEITLATSNEFDPISENNVIKGFMHSVDNRINPATGTIRARALFKNQKQTLLPGMTVSVKMGLNDSAGKKQILLSERAIGTDQDRKFVFIIENNKATYREIKIGQSIKGKRLVLKGLKKGDIVITEGLMRVRPNTPVHPVFKGQGQKSSFKQSRLQ